MSKKINDSLSVLVAQFRAKGGRVSTNVVNGHNVTLPNGRGEVRLMGSREEGPARNRLIQLLRNELNAGVTLLPTQVDELTKAVRAYRAAQEGESGDSEHEAAAWLSYMVTEALGLKED